MKILGGTHKGRNFYMPYGIRPTTDLARKAIFDLLGQDFSGVAFLDLFAGSGSVGLEALSRGAEKAVFVERDPKCAETIMENLRLLGFYNPETVQKAELAQTDSFVAIKQMARQGRKFDVVFLDPPYELGLAKKALKTLMGYDILNPNSVVIIEHNKRERLAGFEERFDLVTERKYGMAILTILRANTSSSLPPNSQEPQQPE